MTVDGTDCEIWEPHPFSRLWYSHKFKGPGLRYEIAVCIQTGDIVWVNGPYKCGRWPDLKIFRDRLKGLLIPREQVEADKGYRGDDKVRHPNMARSYAELYAKKLARGRHETINCRLKRWGILSHVFRHDLNKHGHAFMAVAVLTQLTFDHGFKPFQVNY
jgi:hypothetical protein